MGERASCPFEVYADGASNALVSTERASRRSSTLEASNNSSVAMFSIDVLISSGLFPDLQSSSAATRGPPVPSARPANTSRTFHRSQLMLLIKRLVQLIDERVNVHPHQVVKRTGYPRIRRHKRIYQRHHGGDVIFGSQRFVSLILGHKGSKERQLFGHADV